MVKGYTFQAQLFDSQSWAHIINVFLDKQNGITKGCEIINTADSITIQNGFFVTYGRLSGIIGQELIEVDATVSGELFARLVYEVDLNQANTTTEFNQGSFKVLTSPSAYPALTQEDLDDGGMIYQLLFAEFKITTLGIANFVDKRVFLTLESAQSVFQATFDSFMAGLEAETYVSQAELTSALEGIEHSKATKATNEDTATADQFNVANGDGTFTYKTIFEKTHVSATYTNSISAGTTSIKTIAIGSGKKNGIALIKKSGDTTTLYGIMVFFGTDNTKTKVVGYSSNQDAGSAWSKTSEGEITGLKAGDSASGYNTIHITDVYIDGTDLKIVFTNTDSSARSLYCYVEAEVW